MYGPDLITAVAAGDAVEASDPAPVPWWSFGKTVLAACALILVEQNRLELDRLWPEGFTLRQLLQHRAGLPDYGRLPAYQDAVSRRANPWPLSELLERTEAARLRYPPGRGWAYSNVGYALVRAAIEQAAGRTLDAALQDRLFGPVGIAGVRVAIEPGDLRGCWGVPEGYHPGFVYHGMLVGPAAAAARFLQLLLSGRVLAPPMLAAMLSAVPLEGAPPGRPWRTTGYGLGLMIGTAEGGLAYVGHSGEGPGSVCAVYGSDPSRVASAFTRADDPGRVERAAMALAAGIKDA